MHALTLLLAALVAAPPSSPPKHTTVTSPLGAINAVAGDASWIERYGHAPTPEEARTRDDERHRVHLAWIERKLRAAPVDHLTDEQRRTRLRLLDALADYREIGVHPINERSERLPRFLDRDGRICAVGYLIEVSAGRELVEQVNARWEYDYLLEIEDPALDAWIAASGFTKRELASIQPTGVSIGWSDEATLFLAGSFLLGPTAAANDIAILASASHYGGRGFPDALAVLELIWGAAHFSIFGLLAGEDGAQNINGWGIAAISVVSAVGVAEIIHAIWSLIEPPRRIEDPDAPRFTILAGATNEGAQVSLAGTF
jgi:hypothetical protein